MDYINKKELQSSIGENQIYEEFISQAKAEVDDYFYHFSDSPENTSRWAHHYFCEVEGARLIFNDKTRDSHVCSVCGKEYSTELFNGCWYTMYRNQGVTNAWKSALIFTVTGDEKYLDNVITYADFYNDNYLKFKLHNKEGLEFENLDEALWGTSRIMPQSLNESIFLVRLINALELVRENLPEGFIARLEKGIFTEAFIMFNPQVHKIHNIPTWLDSAIGVMGLFLDNKEMIDFVFNSEFNIIEQLTKGVTEDYFWYEGSIHYNFFLLEGVANLMLFAAINNYDFSVGNSIVEKMLIAAYEYAFDSHLLPNPNDGWPDVNLKTYSYIYSIASKVLGENSRVSEYLGSILNQKGKRGIIPLSKPYYFKNDISLEELLFADDIRNQHSDILRTGSKNFTSSYCGLIKDYNSNIFIKYGHNGPSHAHPDKMNIEVLLNGAMVSHDLSNSGYGNPLCNEWQRKSPSHNTVVVNGESHTGFGGGQCLIDSDKRLKVSADDVYEGVTFTRDISLTEKGFSDHFLVDHKEKSTCDFFFHIEGENISELDMETSDLGFTENGYQHIKNVKKIISNGNALKIKWNVDGAILESNISLENTELFLGSSPDNSVEGFRNTIILRQITDKADFKIDWTIR